MRSQSVAAVLTFAACATDDHATATVDFSDATYSVSIESRAWREQENRYYLRLVTSDIDRNPETLDGEVFVRFDADFRAFEPGSFEIRGLSTVDTPESLDAKDLSSQEICGDDEQASEEDWLGDPAVRSACVGVFRGFSSEPRKLRQRLLGSLHIDRLEPQRLSGRLELWATGVTSDGVSEAALRNDPLFYGGVHLELKFDTAL
jgi:hypothetical protein